MPRLQDIERFKQDLAALSREAEILARWGEVPDDIPPPEDAAELPEEPSAPETAAGRPVPAARPSAEAPQQPDEGLPPDFATLLENLPLEEEGPGSPDAEGPIGGEAAGGAEELGELPGEFEEPASEPEEAPAEESAFELGDFTPLEPENLEAAERAAETDSPIEDLEIPDLGDFDFGTEGEAAPTPEVEEFSIPEMGGETETPTEGGVEENEGFALGETAGPGAGFEAGPGEGRGKAEKLDTFESFSFEEGQEAEPSLGSDLDAEIAALEAQAPPGETFALDQDWAGLGGETAAQRQRPQAGPARPLPQRPEEKTKPVALSEAQVDRLQDALLSYPLNLRVAIEDILANEKGGEAQQSRLIWAMVEDASAESAALLAGRILKRRIEIPRGYEKRTGAAVEAEKNSLRYIFVHTVIPVLRVGFLAALGVIALGWLGWRFVYTPLAADALYRSGYHRIAEDRYPEAEEDFARAAAMHEFTAWYYRYAEAYAAKRQYILAEKKYASLVELHPRERRAILDWARLEQTQLKYEEAVQVLVGVSQPLYRQAPTEEQRGKSGLLSWDYFDREGLLLLGDIYLDWADEDASKFEDARRTYATLIDRYGFKDIYLERMLLYFIRSDGSPGPGGTPRNNLSDILALKKHFLGERRDPLSARAMAELGGYLIDRNLLDDVRALLLAAAKKDPALPEAHYELVRYFRQADMPNEERIALDNAVKTFAAQQILGSRRTAMYIESLIWRGRYRAAAREWIGAEQDFTAAAAMYEEALELQRVKKQPRFGEAYAGLAEVAFWQRDDLDSALSFLERAADSGYDTPATRYRRGYILYREGRFADSLEQFYRAGAEGNESPYLDFAFGSALFERGDYLSAEGYFRRVAAATAVLYAQIDLPQPGQRASQAEILELLMKADDNLGASLLRSSVMVGDPRRRAEAATDLTASARLHDELVGSGVWLAEPRDLASLNLAQAVRGPDETAPLIYTGIEPSMDFPRRGLAELAFDQELRAAQAGKPAGQ